MNQRPLLPLLRLLSLLVITLAARSVAAAPNDAKAEELREQAIFDDYLNLRFGPAEAKLNEAIQLCEADCSNAVKAKLYRDLGVVYVAGLKQRDAGIGMFVEAVTLDANIKLDPDLSSEELQSALDEARELAGAAPPPPGGSDAPAGPVQPPPKHNDLLPVDEYEGVFHTPPDEQLVNTPLPIYVEARDQDWTAKVKVVKLFYRGFGMVRFKEVALPKLTESGYGMEIDCAEIGKSPGKLDYYIVIVDEDGDVAADIGTETSPQSVVIKTEIQASPQPLPGAEIPPQCPMPVVVAPAPATTSTEPMDFSDCPPDFPGCEPEPLEDEDEPPDHMKFPRHWVSLGGQMEFLLIHAVADACSGSATSELTCFQGDVYWDPTTKGGRQDLDGDGIYDDSGSTSQGFAMATKRVLVGYDYAILQNLQVGVRLGFAFGGGPRLVDADPLTPDTSSAFFPYHGELRASYWFGEKVLTDQFVRPFVQLGVGMGQVDAALDTEVIDETGGRACTPDALADPLRSCRVPVEAWRKTGTVFLSGGGGAVFAFTPTMGLLLEGRVMQLLPASGTALAAGGGLVFGF